MFGEPSDQKREGEESDESVLQAFVFDIPGLSRLAFKSPLNDETCWVTLGQATRSTRSVRRKAGGE